jgi:hypothetical protein
MATTKKTVAKKATTRKTSPRKTTARKTAARQTTARRAATKQTVAQPAATTTAAAKATSTVDAVRDSIASAAREADDTVKQYAAVAGEQLTDALEFVRGVIDISVGIPFVVQARVADGAELPKLDTEVAKALLDDVKARLSAAPSVDFDAVKAFLDEAKGEGHARIADVQSRVEPVVRDVSKRVDALRARYAA